MKNRTANLIRTTMKTVTTPSTNTHESIQKNRDHGIGEEDRPSMMSNVHLSFCTERSEWIDLMDSWSELAVKSGQTIYMSPEWALTWWDHFGENKDRQLHIGVMTVGDRLVGILPFYKGVSRIGTTVIEERLQLIGSGGNSNERFGFSDDYGISDFLDFIVDPEFNETVSELFVSLLQTPDYAACRLTLHQLREDSYIIQHVLPLLDRCGRTIKIDTTDTCPYIELAGIPSIETYIKKQKSNARRRLRQARSAFDTDANYHMEAAESDRDLETMLDELIRLHQERWNRMGFPGVFYNPRFRSFFTDITHRLYSKNQVWIRQTRDEEGISSIRMAILYNNRYFDYMSGFDNNSPSTTYRPGIGLLLNLVEHSLNTSVERIDLLRGEEPYKYDFTQKNF
ncbi:MAG: GNAT family N-acetyltransferase, partial [Balneolaceae bacterium]